MQGRNLLGIYITADNATVVCMSPQPGAANVLGCFSVSVESPEQMSMQALATLISRRCAEKGLDFSDVAVALDCAMYMQHSVHSEFTDTKKIGQTVRFDVEEALATDISGVAIAFSLYSTDQNGSKLTVFTAEKNILAELLAALQSNNIDPVVVEPDANCLARFICQNITLDSQKRPFFGLLSHKKGYFIIPKAPSWQKVSPVPAVYLRTFLLGAGHNNRTELLAREIPITSVLSETDEPVNYAAVFDACDRLDEQRLGERLGIETERLALVQSARLTDEQLADCPDPVDFAIACGAALAHFEKPKSTNFRSDFMPYQGGKVRLERSMKFLSAALVVLMLAAGIHGSMRLMQVNKYRSQLREMLKKDYSAAMFGRKLAGRTNPVGELKRAKRKVEEINKGILSATGAQSVSAKLTGVLEAFNKCAASTGLSIGSVSITSRAITIAGDTSNIRNTLKVFETVRKTGMNIVQQRMSAKGGRHTFQITVEPKRQTK